MASREANIASREATLASREAKIASREAIVASREGIFRFAYLGRETLCLSGPRNASPVRAARTGAPGQGRKICCLRRFNSRPHRTKNMHDLIYA